MIGVIESPISGRPVFDQLVARDHASSSPQSARIADATAGPGLELRDLDRSGCQPASLFSALCAPPSVPVRS